MMVNFFDLTPIPLAASKAQSVAPQERREIQAKIQKCRKHIATLQKRSGYRRTDKAVNSQLIRAFQEREQQLQAIISLPAPFGQLYRGKMPRGLNRNPESLRKGIKELKDAKITRVFLLAKDRECERAAQANLQRLYKEHGFKVVYFPVQDFGAWEQGDFNAKAHLLVQHLMQGENIVVHCMGGIGRTGTLIAAAAAKVLKLDGKESLRYARAHSHPYAVETPDQERLIANFADSLRQ